MAGDQCHLHGRSLVYLAATGAALGRKARSFQEQHKLRKKVDQQKLSSPAWASLPSLVLISRESIQTSGSPETHVMLPSHQDDPLHKV